MEVVRSGAGKSLDPVVNPAVRRPLGTRLTDAVGWFGDAVREEAPAAQIVKAVTALETLVMTDEHQEIASLLSSRAAALCYHSQHEKTFEELNEIMLHAYDMRSRLAHGSVSPFDAEVATYSPECLHWAERAICGGAGLFSIHRPLRRTLSRQTLWRSVAMFCELAQAQNGDTMLCS